MSTPLFLNAIVLVTAFAFSPPANARISDSLLRALPAPMNFLEKSNQAGADRFAVFSNDESTPELTRTKLIQALADYVDQGNFDRDLLSSKLLELEGAGQGQSLTEDYSALTLSVLTYNEIKNLMSLKYNCLAYRDDLSEKTKAAFRKRLTKLSASSLDEIDAALRIFSVNQSQGTL